jgi:hypothetical protein
MQKSDPTIKSGATLEVASWLNGSAALAQSTSGFDVFSSGLPLVLLISSAQRMTKPLCK